MNLSMPPAAIANAKARFTQAPNGMLP